MKVIDLHIHQIAFIHPDAIIIQDGVYMIAKNTELSQEFSKWKPMMQIEKREDALIAFTILHRTWNESDRFSPSEGGGMDAVHVPHDMKETDTHIEVLVYRPFIEWVNIKPMFDHP